MKQRGISLTRVAQRCTGVRALVPLIVVCCVASWIPGGASGAAAETAPPGELIESIRDRAEALRKHGHAAEAAELFAEILARQPDDVAAMAGRVRSLLDLDRWMPALAEARRFFEAHPAEPLLAGSLGASLLRAGRIGEAEAHLSPLARRDDPPVTGLVDLGRIRAAEGRHERAVELMERAVASAPEDREVLYWAATATDSRTRTVDLLERYLERSEGDDPERIEGARGTLRRYRALGEQPVWVVVERPERFELPLVPISSTPGTLRGYRVDVAAGGRRKPIRLLLDTGSPGLFLTERIALKSGFRSLAEEVSFGGGGDRRHASTSGLLPSLDFGDLKFTDALITTTSSEVETTGRFHGLVGLSVFEGYQVTLDLPRKRIVLEPPPAEPAGQRYWLFAGQMLVEASASDGSRGLFLLDTGATQSLVSLPFAGSVEGARLGGPTTVRGYGGRLEGVRIVRGVELRFQGACSEGRPIAAADLSLRGRLGGIEISGFLGLDLLGGHRIVIDTVHQRVSVK